MTSKVKKFPVLVKVALLERGMTVKALAAAIGRNRCTTSTAIHTARFPRARAEIARHLKLETAA